MPTALWGMAETIGELFSHLWRQKLWWLIPMIVVLLLFSVLIALGNIPVIGPAIYTLF